LSVIPHRYLGRHRRQYRRASRGRGRL